MALRLAFPRVWRSLHVWEIEGTSVTYGIMWTPSHARMRSAIYGLQTSAPWGTSGRRPAHGVPRRDASEASVLANAGRAYA